MRQGAILGGNRAVRNIVLACLKFVSILNRVAPKDDKRILFYESSNPFPSDNTEALCSWLVEHDIESKYKLTYCVPDAGPFLDRARCRTVNKFRGIIEYLRSKYVFYSYGGMRIKPSPGQVVVNLWHGTPLKTIGKLTDDANYLSEDLDDFTYLVTSSTRFIPIMAAAFDCERGKVKTWGYPRCDYFNGTHATLTQLGIPENKTVILWMPTFRISKDGRFDNAAQITETGLPILHTRRQLQIFDEWLAAKGVILTLKVHGYAAPNVNLDGLKSLILVDDDEVRQVGLKLYEFVSCFDALLTDYSSIAFDYLLLDRPIGYTIDDMDYYQQKRGFTIDAPETLMSGALIRDYEGLLKYISAVEDGVDDYENDRKALREQVWSHTDCFCERVARGCGIEVT